MDLIISTDVLAAFCERAAKFDFVTVDTEFLRETTYWPKLCLIQAATDDEAVLIDPLAPGLDLEPFFELLANPQITKVFHAARQDIEIFVKLTGKVPVNIFDTQIAASVCGFGDSVSYDNLVALDHQCRTRQILPLHRLVGPPAERKAAPLRASPTSPICATSTRNCASRSTPPSAGTGSRTSWACCAASTPMWSSPSRPGNG